MSVSDMNVSWATVSTKNSRKSQATSVFLTSDKLRENSARVHRPQCVSAKNSGMRFQGWREPKPLRSRCGSAVIIEDPEKPPKVEKPKPSTKASKDTSDGSELRESITRLSQPTTSSKWKTSYRTREAGTDMNWYSWSKMNVYKDYQRVLYKDNGTMKKALRGKER